MNRIAEVRFKVLQDATLIDPERQTHISVTGQREHVWQLGLGPCGREVTQLEYAITGAALTIRQRSYPKGYLEAQSACLGDLHCSAEFRASGPAKARRALYESLLAQHKTEQFIYPLETIVGRIRVLEA